MKKITLKIYILLAAGITITGCSGYYYQKAGVRYNSYSYSKAAGYYEKVAMKENYPLAKINLADCYRLMNNREKQEYWYRQIMQSPQKNDSAEFYFARILATNGKYAEAKQSLRNYLKKFPADVMASHLLFSLDSIHTFFVDSAEYSVKLLSLNSPEASCFGAVFHKDGIVFSSEIQNGLQYKTCEWTGRPYLDLYFSKIFSKDSLGSPEKLPGINSNYHEGPSTFNVKGNEMYFTGGTYVKKNKPGNNPEGINILKIYKANKINEQWMNIKEVPLLQNDLYSIGHPALSPDNKKLYFISDMEGGYGGTDIYVSEWEKSTWGSPKNLGPTINSTGNEMFPFFAENGKLYYSSNGMGGMGGMDIFSSSNKNHQWSKPENLGAPLNSFGDDISFIMDGKKGYFSSNRESPEGIDYLYSFEKRDPVFLVKGIVWNIENGKPLNSVEVELSAQKLPGLKVVTDTSGQFSFPLEIDKNYSVMAKNRFSSATSKISTKDKKRSETYYVVLELHDPVFTLKGEVVESETQQPLPGVNVQMRNLNLKSGVNEIITDENGNFSFTLEPEESYLLFGSKENYLTNSASAETVGKIISEQIFVRLELTKLILNKAMRVDNIHYDYNKWDIREDAKPELNKLVKLMQDNPAIQIELSSHCDSRGSDQHNLKLSQKRAEAAVGYIVSIGIGSTRIVARGYGETKLLNKCSNGKKCPEEDHQFNRRTEFKITGVNQQQLTETVK